MDSKTSLGILEQVRTELAKQASPETDAFANSVLEQDRSNLRSEALGDVRNLFLASLGVGLAGRGAVGLVNTLNRNRQKKPKSGPALLPLPYPAVSNVPKVANWATDFFAKGNLATSKTGIPWYQPAMFAGGLAGLGVGWRGLDHVLEQRRKAEREKELDSAREQFHDALISQYAKPVSVHPELLSKQSAEPSTMEKVGVALDALWTKMSTTLTKQAQLGDVAGNLLGAGVGAYGAGAGLAALLSGAFVYDKMKKRSRGAILDKAIQRRRRREFMQRPTEIVATPEPMLQDEASGLG